MSDAHANFAVSLVATAPSPATSGTSLVVTAGQGTRFPAVPFNATICPAATLPTPANSEIVRVTNISTDTLTITRTQESTSARTVVVGDQIAATITAKTLTDVETTANGAVQVSTIDAKGDLLAGTADNTLAKVTVGANGTHLVADSGQSTGVSWLAQTGSILLGPGSAVLPDGSTSNLAPGMTRRQGTQTGAKTHFLTLDFDGGGNLEGAHWVFRLPANYLSGGTLKISWMANATSNNVKWQAEVGAITPGDADTPLEHAFAAAATVTSAVNSTEARRLVESSITLTMDSAAAADIIELYVFRDSADGSDTATVDAEMIAMTFEYVTS